MARCVIFMEGSRHTDNGDLRIGFGQLLRQAGLRQQPLIVMCDDTANAIRKFEQETDKSHSAFERILLLVDLDGPSASRTAWLAAKKLTSHADHIFFMVQKMEAWFLAQPKLLADFYKPKLTHALPRTAPEQVLHPDRELEKCTKGHEKKGSYHKTKHGARLLADSHLPTLQATFPDVARLLAAL
ncbi:DUF4276 family protein [Hymenobacter sp. ASUV-10]|uniref:DUF4276 family protein n=1 Tax=Hymenobacter aranciens TaxID=3063996 RepID=A0ABT9B753_9BACT|nr:DUF4276 family protein [Hymenobacter sp. ASUV-10]MDO7873534.1 DUF4276 family protein [Hymenobacter sp. ASUV-10]